MKELNNKISGDGDSGHEAAQIRYFHSLHHAEFLVKTQNSYENFNIMPVSLSIC